MPPSGHSHSSHSSHSFSSHSSGFSSSRSSFSSHSYSSSSSRSSSSSSRSYGSSRSSSSSSGSSRPSSHSTTSHNSSYSSSYSNTPSHSYSSHNSIPTYDDTSKYNVAMPKIMTRHRTHQPSGHIPWAIINAAIAYHCLRHDYVYYPEDWTNDEGTAYKRGYYDEEGNYYNNVALSGDEAIILTCQYCGTQKKVIWKSGSAPTCENCGAPLKIDAFDTVESVSTDFSKEEDTPKKSDNSSQSSNSSSYSSGHYYGSNDMFSHTLMVTALAAISLMVITLIPRLLYKNYIAYTTSTTSNANVESKNTTIDSIYVEEIGRTCYLDGEDYYDKETDCWFYLNPDTNTWQYWYEGISSDYGDYGWMEYDYNEEKWYIEESNGNWIALPSTYDISYLWHFNNEDVQNENEVINSQPYIELDESIYVESLDRTCYLDGEDYYDEETNCWFYYNQDISPAQWQYWFEDISNNYGDYGWMEYDDNEQRWYIEVENGVWQPLNEDEYTSNLWHFDNQYNYK